MLNKVYLKPPAMVLPKEKVYNKKSIALYPKSLPTTKASGPNTPKLMHKRPISTHPSLGPFIKGKICSPTKSSSQVAK